MRLTLILVATLSFPATAEVYRWTDESGNVHFGSQPPPGEQEEVKIRKSKTGPMITEKQRAMLEPAVSDDLSDEAIDRRYQERVAEIREGRAGAPDYVCQGAKDRVAGLEDELDDLKTQGYTISERNRIERRIERARRHRNNICR